ncbi:hypothetical protein [Shimia abyssi]|uniref:Anti-sigma factor RsiW n=1 Tax=Shimia abyssi TaxID=1662395 RepID=A0A2P8F781_9RHOB|nr:hypothetical protein [Shimia abyssi]PSL17576.1 hypothetical protein CLV88_11623 [Shimia abyssi]
MVEYSREEIQTLLPFMANGSLDEQDREVIEIWLESDLLLQDELTDLQRLRDAFRATEISSPGQTGLNRLLSEVGEVEPKVTEKRSFGHLSSLRFKANKAQWVVALLICTLMVHFGIWMYLRDGARVELASSTETANLIIAFHPKVTEEKMRFVLLELDLQMVAGPSSLGLYRLYSKEPEAALHILKGYTTVVESVTYAND